MSTVIPIRSEEPTLAEKIERARLSKAAHDEVHARFKAVQIELDAACDAKAADKLAVDRHIDALIAGEELPDPRDKFALIRSIVAELQEPITSAAIRQRLQEPNSASSNMMIASIMQAIGYDRIKRRRPFSAVVEWVWLKRADA